MMRYIELFAGAGGLSLGLEAAGMHPVAHAEIEPHARAVLRQHWPDTPLHGDVTQVDWTPYAGQVDLVAGGSPCQDLSVAGKRAGLAGARSGLFFELIRAWSSSGAPYCLWENVDGARSSNKGEDFASVLSAFVGGSVDVPRDGWRRAGVVAGATGVAAWRVLDLQHFGPPQRRRRVFVLAARTGGCDPAEVLALSEGLCGHPAPRERTRQGTARGAAGGVGVVGTLTVGGRDKGAGDSYDNTPVAVQAFGINHDSRAECAEEGVAGLRAGQRQVPAVLAFKAGQSEAAGGTFVTEGFTPTLQGGSNGSTQVPAVLAFHHTQDPISGAVSPSIGRPTDGMGVVAFDTYNQTVDNVSQTLCARADTGGNGHLVPAVLCTTGHVTHALTSEGCDASEDGTGRGTPIVTPTLNMGAHTAAPGSNGQDALEWAAITVPLVGRPRRLTPLECERLMGWPDQHTAHGVKEDGTVYALSDTARYRLCGNGVGTPVAAWIARRLVWAEAHTP